jgi:hypothetical protein
LIIPPKFLSGNTGVAFFCSQTCPGDIILVVQDWANSRNATSDPVIGGFHTPVERDVLRILLRGDSRLVLCPAKSLESYRRSPALRAAEREGRASVVSPFPATQNRTTARTSEERNRFIIGQADSVLIAHASAGGKTEALAQAVVASGKRLFTLSSQHNANLVAMGALEIEVSA